MARLEPFSGLRYESSVPLDTVICPPYDVVDPEERSRLAARSPVNAIRVELPEEDPELGEDRYAAAARLFELWTREGILCPDAHDCFYTYRMTEPDGTTTTGVVGALQCDEGGSEVLPHEQIIPKDMTDRLELLRASHVNTSPIWGLSMSQGVASTFTPYGRPDAAATDDSGVLHELWAVDDPSRVEAIRKGVASAPVVIADGHHRYQTALAYRGELRKETSDAPGDYDLVMALIVELAEDQLFVGAIHRILRAQSSGRRPAEVFRKWFILEDLGSPEQKLVERLVEDKELALISDNGTWRLIPLDNAFDDAGSDLDPALVDVAVKDLGAEVTYDHDPLRALSVLESGEAEGVVLMRPVTVAQISSWARQGRRMPPKSTYFHPKPRTGMVFRELRVR